MNANKRITDPGIEQTEFDFIVVGGGSAGCVMANRLSADASRRVLVIESGPDLGEVEPEIISDPGLRTTFKPEFIWSNFLGTDRGPQDTDRLVPVVLARVLGGGSAINGMHAQRGFPRDYDEWEEFGITDWRWDRVLPYFIKVETDKDFQGPQHGSTGPIPISRMQSDRWSGLSRAVRDELVSRGLEAQTDLNIQFSDGVGPVPLNISPATRVSAAQGYLGASIRARPNLAIVTDTDVDTIVFDGARAVGVSVRTPDGLKRIAGREVVVTCGAINTPALLQKSGIGAAETLRALGAPLVADRRGVGRNLSNHSMVSLNAHVKSKGRPANTLAPPCMMIARYSSNEPDCPRTDMLLNVWERALSPHPHDPLGRQIADFMFILNKPFSRGSVLANMSPNGRPHVQTNMWGDDRDLTRMVGAFRHGISLMNSARVSPLLNTKFLMKFSPLLMTYLSDTPRGRLLSKVGGVAFASSDFLAEQVLKQMATALSTIATDDDGLRDLVRSIAMMGGHWVGSCRIGRRDDLDAVVDERGRVIGVEGLRIADASIFPTVMSAGTNLPVLMAAEKVADHIVNKDN
ncbi:5-(hydroxymethyl)furfural/furfural oxidase [Sphingobium xenophagum]|uniref:5-(Hydroxymethyl)furfural/furfural oxidase n=1 Tax=Sphingobium xenophagum TaxID=121428 RepID=A0ABU1X6L6_SPHXE|nr:GMC family oxidoreductase [Sphingobium xenophagum]MDR7157235.1 5-(hydroxymethyl)furfural/furfural oxidase [Sphingobium xenophagum]